MPGKLLARLDTDAGPLIAEQEGRLRHLHFDNGITQSLIDCDRPGRLPLLANRAMLAHLMFVEPPRNVLLAGCGGGAIARWFHHHAPDARGRAVEINPAVAGLAREWFDFPAQGWQLDIGDIREHLRQSGERYDFILADLEVDGASPDWLASEDFLAGCRDHLSDRGVLTVNWIADNAERFALALFNIRQAFRRHTLCLPVAGHENVMILAFGQPPSLDGMAARIKQAERRWGLEFAQFYRQLERNNPVGSGVF